MKFHDTTGLARFAKENRANERRRRVSAPTGPQLVPDSNPPRIAIPTCDGACHRDGDCSGHLTHVEVFDKDGSSWGRYHYCQTAMKRDRKNGFRLEPVTD